jgi:CDGSH-type Zn-finger protein
MSDNQHGDDVETVDGPAITAIANGPLVVTGGAALYRRRSVHSEHGEPLAWQTTEQIDAGDHYLLCRCGESGRKPFCDHTHAKVGFVADDVVEGTYSDRSKTLGGSGITVRDDRSICVHAGFCGTRVTNVWRSIGATEESTVRAQVITMVEKCPSGALTYEIDGSETEPLFPAAVGVIDDGPLWVTGGVPVTTSDGRRLETRNRVTLCRCGQSENKPLCDGSHKNAGFEDH